MIDAHNHLQDPRFAGRQSELVAEMQSAGITACIVNGTSEDDWPEVAALAEKFPGFVVPSFGLHPWKVDSRSTDWLDTLRRFLNEFPTAALGECGLDRWMESPDLEAQHEVFRAQLALAVELERPLTIHCLKAWGPLLEELKSAPALPCFLLHSFGGSLEVATELQKLGSYFSFSGYFLQPRKEKTRQVFSNIPHDRILVETDAPEMPLPDPEYHFEKLNHPANLALVGRELASLLSAKEEIFLQNTKRFFKI